MLSVSNTITEILKDKNLKNYELAEKVHITKQNLSNKMRRDNFSALELVEIAKATNMKLCFVDGDNESKKYYIEYSEDELFKPKRKESEKKKPQD